jgi:hypothetical protein
MRKTQAWTKKKLFRARVRRERELAAEAREQRSAMFRALRPRPSDFAFRGCDPERTLALIEGRTL